MNALQKFIAICLFVCIWLDGSAQEIALTFDDAPTPDTGLFAGDERTEKILQHLRDNDVPQVCFFVITQNMTAAGGERLIRYASAGHLIANHTHSHRPIRELGIRSYIADIAKADSALRDLPGFRPWFRYPFLDEGGTAAIRDSLRWALKQLGLSNGYITVDNYDWYLNSRLRLAAQSKRRIDLAGLKTIYIEHIVRSVIFYDSIARHWLGRSPKHVLLLHENDLAAAFLGDLIKTLKSNGWKIISPEQAYADPIASVIPDVLFNGQGRVAAIARQKGALPRHLVQPSEDEAFLDHLLDERGLFR